MEKQAKVVNEVSTAFLETFKAHVHDLEDAMIALANTPNKEAALEVALHDTQTQLDQARRAAAAAEVARDAAEGAVAEAAAAGEAERARSAKEM